MERKRSGKCEVLVVRLASDVLAPVFHGELGRILKVKVLEEPKSDFTSRIGQAKCFEAADEELNFFFCSWPPTKVGRSNPRWIGNQQPCEALRPELIMKIAVVVGSNRKFQVSQPNVCKNAFVDWLLRRRKSPCHWQVHTRVSHQLISGL